MYAALRVIEKVLASVPPTTYVPKLAGSVDTAVAKLKFVVAFGTFSIPYVPPPLAPVAPVAPLAPV